MVDNLHSRLVGWAKIIMPLSALALLSTLFLFARQPAPSTDIPFAKIETLAQEQRISSPQFSGVTPGGALLNVSANTAKPDPTQPSLLLVDTLVLTLTDPDGSTLNVTSGTSVIDSAAQTARLDGLARLTTSNGYRMETTGLRANLQSGEITSEGALEIRAPFGQLTAGRIAISVPPDGQGQQMRFTDGVKLLYTPGSSPKTQP